MSKKTTITFLLSTALLVVMLIGVLTIWGLVGIDWKETFYPAASALLHGENPYLVPTFRNAPWVLILLAPFALFSETIGGLLFFIASLALYAWSAYRLGATRFALTVFLLSPPVVYGMRMLNIDVFVLFGFSLPPQIGLFFVLLKPQMGIAMVPFWLVREFHEGGWKQVVKTFAPVTVAVLLSFLVFGNWLSGRQADLLNSFWNASLWPWAVPIGITLIAISIRDLRADFAMAASPFISPYLAYHSWVSVLAGLLKRDFELLIAASSMWFVAILIILGIG